MSLFFYYKLIGESLRIDQTTRVFFQAANHISEGGVAKHIQSMVVLALKLEPQRLLNILKSSKVNPKCH